MQRMVLGCKVANMHASQVLKTCCADLRVKQAAFLSPNCCRKAGSKCEKTKTNKQRKKNILLKLSIKETAM